MKKLMIILILLVLIFGFYYVFNNKDNKGEKPTQETQENEDDKMNGEKLNIEINGTNFTVSLYDNQTAKELLLRLPLSLTMSELNGNEKYYYFDESLPSSPKVVNEIKKGDVMLYGDDCLVIFYKTFKTNYSYTKIGVIDDPDELDKIITQDDIKVMITK